MHGRSAWRHTYLATAMNWTLQDRLFECAQGPPKVLLCCLCCAKWATDGSASPGSASFTFGHIIMQATLTARCVRPAGVRPSAAQRARLQASPEPRWEAPCIAP